jgi:hypothetical protein
VLNIHKQTETADTTVPKATTKTQKPSSPQGRNEFCNTIPSEADIRASLRPVCFVPIVLKKSFFADG